MVLKDGGMLVIPEDTINKWSKLYPNVDVKKVINELNENRSFAVLSKKGALKLINRTLHEINASN